MLTILGLIGNILATLFNCYYLCSYYCFLFLLYNHKMKYWCSIIYHINFVSQDKDCIIWSHEIYCKSWYLKTWKYIQKISESIYTTLKMSLKFLVQRTKEMSVRQSHRVEWRVIKQTRSSKIWDRYLISSADSMLSWLTTFLYLVFNLSDTFWYFHSHKTG